MERLTQWSRQHFNDLPWRRNRSLYRTLVSEIMLQQTTVSSVLNYFEPFLKRYPNIRLLALATEEEVCIAWKGLGYYRRARNLLKAAQFIVKEFEGIIPRKYEQLIEIPGIGDYTANAIIAMGRNKKALCIDANIERVTSRLFGIKKEKGPQLSKEIKRLFDAGEIYSDFDRYSSRELNEALMDLGRVICQANKVDCNICPVTSHCMASKDNPLHLPITRKKKKPFFELDLIRCVVKKGHHILVYKKDKKHWLSGQYELPTFILKSKDKSLKQYPQWKQEKKRPLIILKSSITKYKIVNHVIEILESEAHRLYKDHGGLVYKKFSPDQNLSNITFKILKQLESRSKIATL